MPPSVDQSLRKARRYTRSGETELAATHYQDILQKYPRNQRALAGLNALRQPEAQRQDGDSVASTKQVSQLMALYQQGKLQQVLVFGEALEKQLPKVAAIPNLLGAANANLGRSEQAVVSFTKALQLKPDYDEAFSNRGSCLFDLGRTEEAIANYRKALGINPGNADAHYNLGVALQYLENFEESISSYRRAVANRPDHANAHYNLGYVLQKLGELPESAASYRQAIVARPDFVKAHTSLGNVLRMSGEDQEAIASYQQALSIMPEFASAHHGLGISFQQMGKVEEAVNCYRKATVNNPEYADSMRLLALNKKFSEYDDDIRAMEQCYFKPGINSDEKMQIAFGLGKAYDDLGENEKAFDSYLTGNALKRETFHFSIEDTAQAMDQQKAFFSPELFNRYNKMGASDATPIFILGMPRSGTSLVEQILASHEQVHGAGELNYLKPLVAARFTRNNGADLGEYLEPEQPDEYSFAGQQYIELLREEAKGEQFITDKMPLNYRLLGMIRLMLPNAKVIHCCRDARDTCLSIFKCLFSSSGNRFAYNLEELGRYHNLYLDLMAHWHQVLPGFIYDLQYEDLVADQEAQSKSLLAFCGLEWDHACMEFYNTERPVKTASFNQVRSPIYRNSVQSWKRYENQLAPLLAVLGD